MSLFDTAVFNSTLYEALYLQIEDTLSFAKDFFESCVSSLPIEHFPKSFVNVGEHTIYDDIIQVFYFNEFQFLLLKTFFLILLFTFLLIFVSWRVYGKRISERFMKPGESLYVVINFVRNVLDLIYGRLVFFYYRAESNRVPFSFPSSLFTGCYRPNHICASYSVALR